MNSLIPKNKFITLAATATSLSVIIYFAGLLIVLNKKNNIENSYYENESKIMREEKILALEHVAKVNDKPIGELRSYFIQKGDEVGFIEEIEKLAKISGLRSDMDSINIKTDEADSFKENIDIKMKIESSWGNIMIFLNKLEKMPFGVLVKNINLDTSSGSNWFGFVEFTVFREK